MSAVRKKTGSPYWFACIKLPSGQRTQRSTKTRDRKLALKIASELESAAKRRITEAQARKVLSDIHEQIHGSHLYCPDLSSYVGLWLARKKGEISPATLLSYQHATEEFVRFLGEKAKQPISYLTQSQVAAWRDASATKASPCTANNKLKIIRTLLQTAWRDNLIVENPAAKVQTLRAVESHRRPFTAGELRDVLRVAPAEWKGLVLVGFYTGQRLKDIASLTWSNVDLSKKLICLTTSKTRRRQVIPVAPPLLNYLATLPLPRDGKTPVFPGAYPHGTRTGGSSTLSQQFYEILVSAGFAEPRSSKRQAVGAGRAAPRKRNEITFHSLRHTVTSILKENGASESVARDIIGHESAEISRHYTHTSEDSKRQAIDSLPDLTAFFATG